MDSYAMADEILRWFGSDINPGNVSLMSLEVWPNRASLVVIENTEPFQKRTTVYTKPAST
jgi:hypothetical protein